MKQLHEKIDVYTFDFANEGLQFIKDNERSLEFNKVQVLQKLIPTSDESEIKDKFLNLFRNIFSEYNSRYGNEDLIEFPAISFRQYMPGDSFIPHTDCDEENKGHMIIAYLNDDFEGGVLTFDELGIEYRPKAGEVIVFPGHIMHSVSQIKTGDRYTISWSMWGIDMKRKQAL